MDNMTYPHNSLSPRSKWNGRMFPPATQGGTHRAQHHRCLDRSPAHGSTWNPCDRQRGSPVLTCRARLGAPLKLPGELPTSDNANPPIGYPSFADRLREQMQGNLKSRHPRRQYQQPSYIPKDLATTPQVDSNKLPLHPPFEGPSEVRTML